MCRFATIMKTLKSFVTELQIKIATDFDVFSPTLLRCLFVCLFVCRVRFNVCHFKQELHFKCAYINQSKSLAK